MIYQVILIKLSINSVICEFQTMTKYFGLIIAKYYNQFIARKVQ